jgi:hypothetical protein
MTTVCACFRWCRLPCAAIFKLEGAYPFSVKELPWTEFVVRVVTNLHDSPAWTFDSLKFSSAAQDQGSWVAGSMMPRAPMSAAAISTLAKLTAEVAPHAFVQVCVCVGKGGGQAAASGVMHYMLGGLTSCVWLRCRLVRGAAPSQPWARTRLASLGGTGCLSSRCVDVLALGPSPAAQEFVAFSVTHACPPTPMLTDLQQPRNCQGS